MLKFESSLPSRKCQRCGRPIQGYVYCSQCRAQIDEAYRRKVADEARRKQQQTQK